MVEIKNDILPAQIVLAPETSGIDGTPVVPGITEDNFTSSQSEVVLFQTDATPLPVFTETASLPVEGRIDAETHSVPLNGLQETNITLSGDVPVFIENLSIEMAKKGGKLHNPGKKVRERELDEIRIEKNIPSGTRIEIRNIPGKGRVPCIIKGNKVTPI